MSLGFELYFHGAFTWNFYFILWNNKILLRYTENKVNTSLY